MTASASQRNAGDRIIFASCNSQHYDDELSHTLWPAILSRNASAFVWTGDAIYADDFHPPKSYLHYLLGKPSPKPATPPVIRDLYAHLIQSPGYSKILESNTTILGTLDDHGMFDFCVVVLLYSARTHLKFPCDRLRMQQWRRRLRIQVRKYWGLCEISSGKARRINQFDAHGSSGRGR